MIASTWVISSKKRARIYTSGEKTQKAEGQKGLHCTGRMTLYITLFVALNYILPSSLVECTVAVFVGFNPKNINEFLQITSTNYLIFIICNLKVSKFQKQIFMFSFEPKTKWNYFLYWNLINMIKCLNFFYLTHFRC